LPGRADSQITASTVLSGHHPFLVRNLEPEVHGLGHFPAAAGHRRCVRVARAIRKKPFAGGVMSRPRSY
jgi:hypothetical protein